MYALSVVRCLLACCLLATSIAAHCALDVPLCAEAPAGSPSVVVKTKAGRVVPSQVEERGGRLMVTWIADHANGDNTGDYRIVSTQNRPKPDPRGVRIVEREGALDVNINGRLFTRYVFTGTPKPYCYPIIGPGGKPVTRNFPMRVVGGESTDHPHHRSFWFTFGSVNGIDFWGESPRAGKIIHRQFERLQNGSVYGLIRSRNDWVSAEGKKVCEDVRELRVYAISTGRLMDFTVTVRATEGPVVFGDTKEGMLGFRVASSMEVDRGQGHIENSRGNKDGDAWGKQAEWCDYYGPVDGKTIGVTIMEHPTSFRHPTYWHVRTYGLFAANPFGVRDFTGDKTKDGSYTIPAGGEITFRYRIFVHEGTTADAHVPELYAVYAKSPVE